MDREYLIQTLRKYYGAEASYREGQLEAIESAIMGNRILVVQKTGWGKSLVYFMTTKILREQGSGLTLIVSPLLVLMENQIDAAYRIGLNVCTINSQNSENWNILYEQINANEVDALIISPERLANDAFREKLSQINNIGLFVIDEAHCISDWGHDFRPDYRRIVNIVNSMPKATPLIATTATANDRVVDDIKKQLGDDVKIYRGHLMRDSLNIQTINLEQPVEKLAWLKENIKYFPGSGVIYCLTINDCEMVAKWLKECGIKCEAYHSKMEDKKKTDVIQSFMKNGIKALVATVAFGMGFDKPDIGFVIHYQKPKNVVAYYQQIGRAGRSEDMTADIVLLYSRTDDEINDYFIDSAFPTEELMLDITRTLEKHGGLTISDLEFFINAKRGKIEACIKYLAVEGAIYSQKTTSTKYYRTLSKWEPDRELIERITAIRRGELEEMNRFARLSTCYMKFLAEALDDKNITECGHCTNCLKRDFYPRNVKNADVSEAEYFIRKGYNTFSCRKKLPNGLMIPYEHRCEDGIVLSAYADAGWGREVANGKYKYNHFSDELVDASINILQELVEKNDITWVTYIDSINRPDLVKDFAVRVAGKLGLPCKNAIIKTDPNALQQKYCENSNHQYKNVEDSFDVNSGEIIEGENVLLIDDMVDSKWTLTVCGLKLREKGSGKVFPFALASTAGKDN